MNGVLERQRGVGASGGRGNGRERSDRGEGDDGWLPEPRRCALYLPGHTAHPIQARLGWEDETPGEDGRLRNIEGNELVIEFEGGERRFRNHEAQRLAAVAERLGERVVYRARLGLLRFSQPAGARIGGFLFCVAVAEATWRECVSEAPRGPATVEQIAHATLNHGGFFGKVHLPPDDDPDEAGAEVRA